MKKVKVEFIGVLPTFLAHCEHCMQVIHQVGLKPYSEQLEEYPEDIRKQYFQLSEIAHKLKEEFGSALDFDAIDPSSPSGLWFVLRHRILRTPCILINRKKVFDGIPSYDQIREKVLEEIHKDAQSVLPR